MINFKAVLFDFDGTLADTMEDNFFAWKESFLRHDVNIAREDYFPLEGLTLLEIAERICKKYSINPKISNEIVKFKNELYIKNHKFKFYPWVEELIKNLKKNKFLALVSASPKEKLKKTVPKYFLNSFDAIISGDDIKYGKPNPEPYLKAIEALSVDPKSCIAIENAPLGIQSAKAAGVYCIAIPNTLPKKALKSADRIVDNLKNLEKILLK